MRPAGAKTELVATVVAGHGCKLSLERLSQLASAVNSVHTQWLELGRAADLFCNGLEEETLQSLLKTKIGQEPFDVIVQAKEGRRKRFLIADMESTIIEQEMLDELADVIGLRRQVASITKSAMNGDLDFATALRQRVALLQGKPLSILGEVAQRITYAAGAKELVATMRAGGGQCWLVSGGFHFFVHIVAEQLGFDRYYANDLGIEDGKMTGTVREPILDKSRKQALLEQACGELKLSLSETLAVGDGANDIPMLSTSYRAGGLAVAYEAKPKVRAIIPQQINHSDLTTLLFAQGYKTPFASI